jgi:hypothetical protein
MRDFPFAGRNSVGNQTVANLSGDFFCLVLAAWIIVFDVFKRSMTRSAIVLRGQQLLAEQGENFGLARTAIGTEDRFTGHVTL